MARRAPQVGFARFSLLGATLALLAMASLNTPTTSAQTSEGTLGVAPTISSVPAQAGPFAVYVVMNDLQHFGVLEYDDNRDGTPDRQVASNGLGGFEFTIQYNANALAVAGISPGPELARSGRSFQCLPPRQEPGLVTYGCLSPGNTPDGPQGTLTLAEVTFTPLAAGSSPLALAAEVSGPLGSDNVPLALQSGVVRVTGTPITPATPTSTAAANATPNATDNAAAQATARRLGAQTPGNPATATAIAAEVATLTASSVRAAPTSDGGDDPPDTASADDGGDGSMSWWLAGGGGAIVLLAGLSLGGVLWLRHRHRGA